MHLAARHRLTLSELHATHELGTIDLLRANRIHRLTRARELVHRGRRPVDHGHDRPAARHVRLARPRPHRGVLTTPGNPSCAARMLPGPRACSSPRRSCWKPRGMGSPDGAPRWRSAIADGAPDRTGGSDLEASAWAHRGGYALLREDHAGPLSPPMTAPFSTRLAPRRFTPAPTGGPGRSCALCTAVRAAMGRWRRGGPRGGSRDAPDDGAALAGRCWRAEAVAAGQARAPPAGRGCAVRRSAGRMPGPTRLHCAAPSRRAIRCRTCPLRWLGRTRCPG